MNLIKKELSFFFGDRPRGFDIVIINLVSILLGVGLAYWVPIIRDSTTLLQKIIIILIAWDDLGGVIANLTKSTNDYHAASRSTRLIFYSLHFIQPLVIYYFFEVSIALFLFSWLYPVITAFMVSDIVADNYKNTFAGVFWLIGILLYIYVIPVPMVLMWFGITFFTKLIFHYAIDHFPVGK